MNLNVKARPASKFRNFLFSFLGGKFRKFLLSLGEVPKISLLQLRSCRRGFSSNSKLEHPNNYLFHVPVGFTCLIATNSSNFCISDWTLSKDAIKGRYQNAIRPVIPYNPLGLSLILSTSLFFLYRYSMSSSSSSSSPSSDTS